MFKNLALAFAVMMISSVSVSAFANTILWKGNTDGNLMELFKTYDTIIIRDGWGGYIDGMYQSIEFLEKNPNKKVIIDGACASACTLLLNVKTPNVGWSDNARFQFHSSYTSICSHGALVHQSDWEYNQGMFGRFNTTNQRWIVEHRAYDQITPLKEMSKAAALEGNADKYCAECGVASHGKLTLFTQMPRQLLKCGQ